MARQGRLQRGDGVRPTAPACVQCGAIHRDQRRITASGKRLAEGGAVGGWEIVEMRRDDGAEPDLLIGREHNVEMLGRIGMEPHHVLDRGDPAQETFGGADQRADANLSRAARGERPPRR